MGKKIKKIEDLLFDNRNINKGTPFGTSLLHKSLQEVGAGRSVLADKNGILIAGNKTIEAAGQLGITKIKVVETHGDEIVVVQRTDMDINSKAGATMKILDNTVSKHNYIEDATISEAICEEYKIEPVAYGLEEKKSEVIEDDFDGKAPIVPITKLGDLYELNEHRVLCGDSTKTEEVEKLMNGRKADMVFTDPPYGVNYDGGHANSKRREKLKGDDSTDLYEPCCKMAYAFSIDSAPLYLWHAGVKGITAAAAAVSAGFEIRCQIIWNKQMAQFGAIGAQYKQKHEPCYYCYKKGKTANWVGANNEVTVWDVDRSSKNEFHPTQKPVALPHKAMLNHSVGLIADFFLGSASTMMAAEQLNRTSYGLELSESYCDVIVARYVKYKRETGGSLVIKRNGRQLSDKEIQKYLDNTK